MVIIIVGAVYLEQVVVLTRCYRGSLDGAGAIVPGLAETQLLARP
jgi:hypothetical protein